METLLGKNRPRGPRIAGECRGLGGQALEQAGFDAVEFLGADDAFVLKPDELRQFLPEAFRRQPGLGGGSLGGEGYRGFQGQGLGPPPGRVAWSSRWAPL